MFHQVLTQWMPPTLISTCLCPVLVRSVKASSGALNVRYMTDCFHWSEKQKDKKVEVQVVRENKIAEKRKECSKPSWWVSLAAAILRGSAQAWVMPPTDTPIRPEPLWGNLWKVVPLSCSLKLMLYIFNSGCTYHPNGKHLIYSFIRQFFFPTVRHLFAVCVIRAGSVWVSLCSSCCMTPRRIKINVTKVYIH